MELSRFEFENNQVKCLNCGKGVKSEEEEKNFDGTKIKIGIAIVKCLNCGADYKQLIIE